MLRIFRHYIPKSLILFGVAESLILLVSIYIGATFDLAVGAFSKTISFVRDPSELWWQAIAFCIAMLAGMMAMGFYQRDQRDGPIATMIRLLLSFAVGFVMMIAVNLLSPGSIAGGLSFVVALLSSFIGIASCRLLCYSRTDSDLSRRILVLGVGDKAQQIDNLRRASDRVGIKILGFIDLGKDPRRISDTKVIRPKGSILELATKLSADEIVIAIDDRRNGLPLDQILDCKMHGLQILDTQTFFERQLGKIRLDELQPSNMIFSDGFTQAIMKQSEKRILDVVASSILLLASLPVLVITAIAIKLEGPGPILYGQKRVGWRGKDFTVYKFRSMREDAEGDGVAVWAKANDDRVTKVGGFIRQCRIDELPQLFNVLNGDMSFVGPRPERPEFVDQLSKAIPYYDLRHHIKPGITGWAQVSYQYGASINDSREKLQYDLYYLKNYSLFLDLNILLLTVQVILWGKGAR
ncbi:MAG: sugar transferase (PEP-CTERM system associated) [Gammaproteobacteria bacterium]|jgi:sugar transferase (PEP-CTERM system associated)